MDLLLAGSLALVLLGIGGYLFRNQAREYRDIHDQAKIQAELKLALQSMTRLIGNLGALLPNPLDGLVAAPDRLDFAYIDVPGRFCSANTRVFIAFYTESSGGEDRLHQSIACTGGARQVRRLATTPQGGLRLAFRYLDKDGGPATTPSLIKAVELTLALESGPALAGRRFEKTREQVARIQCVNL